MTKFWVGTSGFEYPEWRGSFYPSDIPEREMLRYYGGSLPTLEVAYTFHKIPNTRTLQGWARDTPDTFTFSLKAPRRITHEMQLRDASDPVTDFCAIAKVLKGKVGALLFQLPPFLRKDLPRLEDFLHQLPTQQRIAFEFRNPSWFSDDVLECLRRFDVALCLCDHADRETPFVATAGFGYLRLRRPAYAEADLHALAQRIAAIGAGWSDAFVYFKHEAAGRGPEFARALTAILPPAAPIASA